MPEEHDSDPFASRSPPSVELTPSVKGKERLYGWYPPGYNTFTIPSYKILSTFQDGRDFNSNIKGEAPSTATALTALTTEASTSTVNLVNVATSIQCPRGKGTGAAAVPSAQAPKPTRTQLLVASSLAVPSPPQPAAAAAAVPCIKSRRRPSDGGGEHEPPRQGLHARFDAIRRDLMRRQRESPMVRLTSATSSSNKFDFMTEEFISRKQMQEASLPKSQTDQPVYSVISSSLQNRIPEPDLRFTMSPMQSRPSSVQSTASLRRSISLPSTATGPDQRPPTPPKLCRTVAAATAAATGAGAAVVDVQALTSGTAATAVGAATGVTWGQVRQRPATAQPTTNACSKGSLQSRPQSPVPFAREEVTTTPKTTNRYSTRPKTAPAQLRRPIPTTTSNSNMIIESTGGVSLCLHGQRIQSATRHHRKYQEPPKAWPYRPPPATNTQPTVAGDVGRDAEETAAVVGQSPTPPDDGDIGGEIVIDAGEVEDQINERQIIQTLLEDDYDRALNKYGWRMQVHADPLHIKRNFLSKRQNVTVKVPEPEVLPQPPSMHKENRETFFHTSMPRKVLSFEIAPDFMSERYNMVREKMRKDGLWNYSDKNFSFVY